MIWLGLAGLIVWPIFAAIDATAGPAHYDPEKRTIRFTYMFASLAQGQFGEAAIGAPQTPSNEQDAKVRTIVLKVSDALSKATAGRMKISTLDLVTDVRRADVVISLTGKPSRGGWAIAGAIEGRPGQIGLYYQTLADEWEQDSILTAAHEVCHYVFGLVDEYNFPRGCPLTNPGGPGCLMDNYLSQGSRHGWYGRLCAADHVHHSSQAKSCQEIVDKFFNDRNVSTTEPGEPVEAGAAVATVAGRKSRIDNIVRAAMAKVREEVDGANKDNAEKKPGTKSVGVEKFKKVAEEFLKEQFASNGVNLESKEVQAIRDNVLKQAGALVSVAIPPQFEPIKVLVAKFAATRARELREQMPKESEEKLRKRLAADAWNFLSGLSGTMNAPRVGKAPSAEEKQYLDHVAMEAMTQLEEKKANEELYKAALGHIELDRQTARTVLDIAGEVGVVGIENRLTSLGEVDADLRPFIPGRTASTGFGLRRTIIVDPDPLDPRFDYILSQAGMSRYEDLRDQYVELFTKLIQRAKIELITTQLQRRRLEERRSQLALSTSDRAQKERIRRIAELGDRSRVRSQRETELRALINEVAGEVGRNRIENVIFLVPPGGIPKELVSLFEAFRRQILIKGDVRIDLVLVSSADVPAELRDIAVGSNGSIITVADVDEVGAVAQRLKNEQTSGSWVILPYQDRIDGPAYVEPMRVEPWMIEDVRRGEFQREPIEEAHGKVVEHLANAIDFFRKPKDDVGGALAVLQSAPRMNKPVDAIALLRSAQALRPDLSAPNPNAKDVQDVVAGLHKAIAALKAQRDASGTPAGGANRRTATDEVIGVLEDVAGLNGCLAPVIKVLEGKGLECTPDDITKACRVLRSAQSFGHHTAVNLLNRAADANQSHAKVIAFLNEAAGLNDVKGLDGGAWGAMFLLQNARQVRMDAFDAAIKHLEGLPKSDQGSERVFDFLRSAKMVGSSSEAVDDFLKASMRYSLEPMGAIAVMTRADVMPEGDVLTLVQTMDGLLSLEELPPADVAPTGEAEKDRAARKALQSDALSLEARTGLLQELESIKSLVLQYNKRRRIEPATDLRYAVLEHVIRARASFAEVRAILAVLLDAHRPYVSVDFNEDELLGEISRRQPDQPDSRMRSELIEALVTSLYRERMKFSARSDDPSAQATAAYLSLRIQEARLRLVQEFLHHIEQDISASKQTPLFQRINRESQVLAYQMIQDKVHKIDAGGGELRPVLPPVDVVDAAGHERRKEGRFRLPRFYAENVKFDPKKPKAEFELVLGLSRPLPGLDDEAIRSKKVKEHLELNLYNHDGRIQNTPTLELDPDLSTPTCLVYRFAPEYGETGWYQAGLILNETTFRRLGADRIHMTFSVASTTPNIRLTTSLVQLPDDPELVPPPPRRGLVRAMDRRAILEVQVYGGTSVLGASLIGTLQKIDGGTTPIEPIAQDFHDDGHTYNDKTANDGVYTTIIALDRFTVGSEYRVVIQAESTRLSKNIAPEDPGKNDEARRRDAKARGDKTKREKPVEEVETPAEEPALKFQRASSIQIRVEP
ncbi:hypothetical protein [Paludisphaera soli]|uniref:hypothetical protein n=1 Tax=Paludisphaera soli TaxID=2712865 RepID=UPI0013EBC591|nr:hypothetical protein [Paludisphaera soli]